MCRDIAYTTNVLKLQYLSLAIHEKTENTIYGQNEAMFMIVFKSSAKICNFETGHLITNGGCIDVNREGGFKALGQLCHQP